MTESDYAAHLNAIRAAPGDDLPRRIFADRCEEEAGHRGRAEFCDVQCRIAAGHAGWCKPETGKAGKCGNKRPDLSRCGGCVLRGRERKLVTAHWRSWVCLGLEKIWNDHIAERTLHGRWDLPEHAFDFARGFVDMLTLDWPACRDHLHAVLRREPVRKVVLTTVPEVDGEYSGGTLSAVLVGCEGDGVVLPQHTPNPEVILALLRAEWPEVAEWELPVRRTFGGTVIAEISRDFDRVRWDFDRVRREGRA